MIFGKNITQKNDKKVGSNKSLFLIFGTQKLNIIL